jgi:putative nucleotidyltransferase with HDIG domain
VVVSHVEAILGEALSKEEPSVLASDALALAITELERGCDVPMDRLRDLAFSDPAVAAELLSAANAGRSEGDEIVSLPAAVALIGEAMFLRVLRAQGRRAVGAGAGPLGTLRLRAARVAHVSAMLCAELADERGLDADAAYTCGLLHDVGRLATLAAVERLTAGSQPARGTSMRRWERIADRWHVVLGATYADRLALPRIIFESIAFHHATPVVGGAAEPLLAVVRSVDALVSVFIEGTDPVEAVDAGGLSDDEAARLAQAVLRIPLKLPPPDKCLSIPSTPRPGRTSPVHEAKGNGLRLRLAGAEYVALGFAPHQLFVRGPAPLGEGALLEVQVLDRDHPDFHVRVLTAWEDSGRFGAILLPLGLSGPSLAELGGTLPAGSAA